VAARGGRGQGRYEAPQEEPEFSWQQKKGPREDVGFGFDDREGGVDEGVGGFEGGWGIGEGEEEPYGGGMLEEDGEVGR